MENAVDKKVLAKRSRTLPMIIFVIGTSLLGGAIFYTTQLAATRDKAFMLTFTIIFYLASAVMLFFSLRLRSFLYRNRDFPEHISVEF